MANVSPTSEFRERLRAEALRLGFSRCGFTTAEPLGEAADRRWRQWLAEGRAGAMTYLERELPRRTHPRDILPEARTAVVVIAGYYDGNHDEVRSAEEMRNAECGVWNQTRNPKSEIRNKSEIQSSNDTNREQNDPTAGMSGDDSAFRIPHSAFGKVARYAWGRDYHDVMRGRLAELGAWLAGEAKAGGLVEGAADVVCRPCVDSAPLDERALAARAGLGFIGKNTLLLTPDGGSWALIGVLLTSLDLPPDAPLPPAPEHSCGNCRRCIEACPTGAIDAPYRVDPRRCISYLTIEQKEAIPKPLAEKMRGWAFGCDICQEVCPFNARPLDRLLPELAASEGVGPWFDEAMLAETPTGKAFERRWGHTPLARPGRKGMRRNLDALKCERDKSGNQE
jgi:epoxyqueuosine reductase